MGKRALRAGSITARDLQLLTLAASYHDIEHGLQGRANEEKSVEIVTTKMQAYTTFNAKDISTVKRLIMATITNVQNNVIVQSATDDYLEQIITDSDLSVFGRDFDIFWDRSQKLYKEHHKIIFSTVDKDQKLQYIQTQIEILSKHTFYTKEAKQLFNQKSQNISQLNILLNSI